jgi:DNA repair exonuclease SbcCD nuclease subunit
MNLFKRAIFFTDVHFGLKSNSRLHNQDCLNFVDFVIKTGKEQNCETCVFLGDWHNNRASLQIGTLNYSVQAIDKLSAAFDQIIFIPGNHDEHYRDTREMNSVVWAKKYDNVRIFDEITTVDDVCITPWLVGDEHKQIKKIEAKYMFGHFELPSFYMNAMVQMPDVGDLRRDDLKCETVFTGHFHKRQTNKNITYIGNAFPHNYADVGDDDRGCMILDWGKDPVYVAWPDAPKYRKFRLSEILEDTDRLLLSNMYCRVEIDVDISYEEATFIKEQFIPQYNLRELSLIQRTDIEEHAQTFDGEVNFESVDSIVTSHLTQLETAQYDRQLMLDIYRNL